MTDLETLQTSDNKEKELQILQTLFSNAYIGLKRQDWQKAVDDGSCKYKIRNLKCGIGHSIHEENYTESIEGKPVYVALQRDVECNIKYDGGEQPVFKALNIEHLNKDKIFGRILGKLQSCHDSLDGSVQNRFEEFADKYELTIPDDDYQITYL